MSRAETLFRSLRDEGSTRVMELIEGQITEELFLDFKNVSTMPNDRKLSESDRKNMAKAISGFGNSEGGVVIWGIDCRRDQVTGMETVDANFIPDALRFKSLLDNAIGGLTSPPHQSVESIAIEITGKGGVVVTHVPEGLNVPYRSNVSAAGGYYMRAGSSFEPVLMHFLLECLGGGPRPSL